MNNILAGGELFIVDEDYKKKWGLRVDASSFDIRLVRYDADEDEQEQPVTLDWATGNVSFNTGDIVLPAAVRTVTADTDITLTETDALGTVLFSTTSGGSGNTITVGTLPAGRAVVLKMTARDTNDYTMSVSGGGTLTFDDAGETATIVHDGTDVHVVALNGATIA